MGSPALGHPADAGIPVRAVRARAAVGALAVVALLVGTVPLVAGRVDAEPVDPRRYVQPPRVDSLDENPLIRISGWALNPDQHLFDVTATVSEYETPSTSIRNEKRREVMSRSTSKPCRRPAAWPVA